MTNWTRLQYGYIDTYVEYTASGMNLINKGPTGSLEGDLDVLRRELIRRNIEWLEPLGFYNNFEIVITKKLSDNRHVHSISDFNHIAEN